MKTAPRLLQNVKGSIPPADFYRAELTTMPPPRGGGWREGGLCPFHDDTHTGSFRVNLETGGFKCFACAAKGADIIAFIQLRDGLSFPEALRQLSDDWGV